MSSTYAISLGMLSSRRDFGISMVVLTSLRAHSRFTVNSMGLRPSPYDEPVLSANGVWMSALCILVSSTMWLRRMSNIICLLIVLKATNMSVLVIFKLMWCILCVFAASYSCVILYRFSVFVLQWACLCWFQCLGVFQNIHWWFLQWVH